MKFIRLIKRIEYVFHILNWFIKLSMIVLFDGGIELAESSVEVKDDGFRLIHMLLITNYV